MDNVQNPFTSQLRAVPRLGLCLRRRTAAFTLVELLVVILIIGILLAVAAPALMGHTDKAKDSEAKQELRIAYKALKARAASEDGKFPATEAEASSAVFASEPQLGISVTEDPQPGNLGVCASSPEQVVLIAKSEAKDNPTWRQVVDHTGEHTVEGDCDGPAGGARVAAMTALSGNNTCVVGQTCVFTMKGTPAGFDPWINLAPNSVITAMPPMPVKTADDGTGHWSFSANYRCDSVGTHTVYIYDAGPEAYTEQFAAPITCAAS